MVTFCYSARKRFAWTLACLIATATLLAAPAQAETPALLRMFGKKSVEADPNTTYELSEEDGPWLVLAGTFAGTSGLERAQALILELRRDYDLTAFIYREDFDFTGRVPDLNRGEKAVVYANPQAYETFSVLVGEFDSVDHPDVDRVLETIKTATPKAYDMEGNDNSPLAAVRNIHRQLLGTKKSGPKGPMANAFVTRNPLVPEEFFHHPEVDAFVMSMNKEVEYSLLDNPGQFTVVVRTFEGLTTLVDGKHDKKFKPSADRLNDYANQAHKMVTMLRKEGVEAYEFHDRRRSLVTIGSFENLGVRTANGGFQYDPAILKVMRERSAGTPGLQSANGQPVTMYANHVGWIPYDVNPKPIAVPKKSKRSLYTATMDVLGQR